ncbi:DUF805 domain-containing protein [Roseicyclus mahoneyensis]|jgi:uncharacterized membrane protein YhaH (DUF805 family)|uniref:Uncharacterized membrane protein YhaH (DUF805 family) n=1 Tax=Roseicyclus mahoneyensis TaxID=164332 RepID=A0A316GH54_9RHOB|nr:DUF805 domain-containing protein [Roseicyclus mahoneyensis]PWK59889.1 uncharacterized membrane protein YhaH (DUF805 family) [Roseicyclus mahoneyensis]
MDFMTSVRTCLGKYATFSGRAQRSEYWWFVLFNFIGSIILNIIDTAIIGVPALSIIWALGLLLPALSVSVRRMHDLDKSGWWILVAFIPLLGFILIIYWFVQRGTEGPNRFGSDPLASGRYAAA